MNTSQYKEALLSKQRELEEEIARQRSDGQDARVADVEDPIDYVTSSEGQATAFEISSRLSDTLEAVRDALGRIDDGTYGTCIDCGEPIEEARLRAVPWTPYCKTDQEKHDQVNARRAEAAAAGDIS